MKEINRRNNFAIQQFVIWLMQVKMGLHLPANVFFAFSMILIVIFALFSAHYVERPVERLLREKWLKRNNV